MRTNILVGCGVLVAGLAVSAQTPQSPPQPSTPSTPATTSADAAGTVTVTGCLATWDGKSAAGSVDKMSPSSAASSTASAMGASYMLTNVQGSSSAASGTSAASYVLKADSTVNLSAHLNHKVTITGSVDKSAHASSTGSGQPSTARPGTPNPTNPTSDSPAAGSGAHRAHDMGSMKPQTLKVTNVTMVSATCP